jgi:hypothetical protein
MISARLQRIAAAIFLVFLMAGPSSAQNVVISLPAEDRQIIESHLGPGIVGKALPSSRIDDVSAYFPLREVSSAYQVVSGPNAGSTQILSLAKVKRPAGKTAWRFQLSPSLASFIRPTAGGDLIVPAVADMGEGVLVITTPANLFLVKGMKPGESRSYVQQVTVDELDDPSDQRYSGTRLAAYQRRRESALAGVESSRLDAGRSGAGQIVLLRLGLGAL